MDVSGFSVIVSKDHPQPDGTLNAEVSRKVFAGPTAQALVRVGNLKPDTQYYYQVIAIQEWPGPDAGMFKMWTSRKFGAFWTLQRKTSVVFREVHMIDDADDWGGGDGDFTFWFWVHQESPVNKAFGEGVVGSGETHDINTSVEVIGLPDNIAVTAYAYENDWYDWPAPQSLCSSGLNPGKTPPSVGENVDGDCGYETAVGSTNLTLSPAEPFDELISGKTFSFKAKEDWMEFDIHGQYSVDYTAASPSKPLPEVTQPPMALNTWIFKPPQDDCTQPDWQPQPNSPFCTAIPLKILSNEPDQTRLIIEWQKRWKGNWIPYCKPTNPHGLGSVEWFQKCNNFYRDHDSADLDISIPHANFPVTKCQRVRATSIDIDTGIKGPPSKWQMFYVPHPRPHMVNAKVVANQSHFSLSGFYNVKFTWTAGCTNVTEWYLGVGTSQPAIENAPYGNIYAESTGTSNSVTVTNIPEHGKVYVRLRYQQGGNWGYTDYTYPSFKYPTPSP